MPNFDDVWIEPLNHEPAPLRIAVVTETYWPDINGVAKTLGQAVQGLLTKGHEVTLFRTQSARSAIERRDDSASGLSLEQTEVLGLPIPFYPELRIGMPAQRRLLRAWSQRRPDVVHIATEGPLGWSALKAAKRLKLPVVSEFRTNFHAYSTHYKMAWLKGPIQSYLRRFHNASTVNLVPTQRLADELRVLGFERLQVIQRGVDTDVYSPSKRSMALRELWGAAPDDVVLLSVSRLAPEKNLIQVIQAHAAIQAKCPRVKLVLVGDGPERERLMAMAPNAIFTGYQSAEALAQHYASADVFAFASQTETFGNVTLEAMASGLCVVAFDHAAAHTLIEEGVNGRKLPLHDAQGFVRAVGEVCLASDLRQRLGHAARRTSEAQSWASIVAQLETTYRDLLPARTP